MKAIYEVVGSWLNVDPRYLLIKIACIREYQDQKSLNLSFDDFIWNDVYDFY
jgi:hypothetical protein